MGLFTDALGNLRRPAPVAPRSMGLNGINPMTLNGTVELVNGLSTSYYGLYKSQPWVYAAVNKLARSVARMPLKPYQRDGLQRERLFEGELARLMKSPYYRGTPFHWKERAVKNVATYGNHIVVKLGANSEDDVPDELMPAPPIGWSLGENDTYVWQSQSGERYPFPRWQIIHYRFFELDEEGFGLSMLEPLRRTLAIEDAASRLSQAMFNNSARPSGVLKTDQTLTTEVIDRLRANIERLHGGVDKAFKLAILEQGLDWVPMGHSLMDAGVLEHRKLTREEVAAVLDVPQPTIGILDEANFASVDMLQQMLYQNTLAPWVSMIEETTQVEFVDLIPEFENQFVEFDLNAVLRGDIRSRYRAYATALSSGFKTPNEIRALENDPPMDQPGADELHFPLNQSGAVGAQVAEDTGQPDDAELGVDDE